MLRKHNKLIILLVLATFMFSIVGTAGAATFSDVTGSTKEAAGIYKLKSFGILDGYPDGTFKPTATITRAEFAKISVYMAGLQSVATGMQGVPSAFTDVKADHWANGWINTAAAQGFVKGYPNGTFGPEAQISQSEVITVLLRILGYNDNLPGTWPANYIAKAANLKILDDITFLANKAATRGEVSVMGAATLDKNMVNYIASDNIFTEKTKGVPAAAFTLAADKFETALTEDALVLTVNKTNGVYELVFADGRASLKFADNYTIAGATSTSGIVERFVDYIVDEDNKVTYVDVKPYGAVTAEKIEITTARTATVAGKIKIADKTYNFVPATTTLYATSTSWAAFEATVGVYENRDKYTVILNEDGDVAMVKAWNGSIAAIVEEVVGDRIFVKENTAIAATVYNYVDKDIFVLRNNVPVTLKDIKPGDTLWVATGANARGADYKIDARDTKVTGVLESALANGVQVDEFVINGKTYESITQAGPPATNNVIFSLNGGKDWKSTFLTMADIENNGLYGKEVTLMTTSAGTVCALIANVEGTSAATGNYAMVTEKATQPVYVNSKLSYLVTVLKPDGEEYSYPIYDETRINTIKVKDTPAVAPNAAGFPSAMAKLAVGQLANITLDSNGMVDKIDVGAALNTNSGGVAVNTDLNTIQFGGKWYAASDVVLYNANNNTVLKWSEYKDSAKPNLLGYYVDGAILKYAVLNSAAVGSANNYAIFIRKGVNVDGDFVELLSGTTSAIYKLDTDLAGTVKGDVVQYTISGGKVNLANHVAIAGTASKVDLSNNIIEITVGGVATGYLVDSDTQFFDCYDTTAPKVITGRDIARGEKVKAFVTGNILDYVVIVK
jgi:hypothetical protein